ncbi:FkbM family methyltransferase [Terasakiella sp. SH-1]|uniref:FkbM family methyltransferase n=1 Tax=Terasakiella sp. SH-1 TaxID=2560057 RepID=UPI00142FA880|nr:FkbM family methyltransferase [Terasakiella sp. SH-1]
MKQAVSEFKAKHIKHRFLYKLYRLMKFRPFQAYASWGEDLIVARIYRIGRFKKKNYRGTFVDVGCNHPVIGNTTYPLYKMGWTGLNIDLTADNIMLCNRLRKKDKSIQRAITQESGEIESYIFDPGSGLNTLDKKAADEGSKLIGKPYSIEKIKADPLNTVIEEQLGTKKIDVLNVDVEGHEMSVLGSFDFATYAPDIIICEIHAQTVEAVTETKIYQHIKKNNYHCFSYCGSTALFARNGWDYTL